LTFRLRLRGKDSIPFPPPFRRCNFQCAYLALFPPHFFPGLMRSPMSLQGLVSFFLRRFLPLYPNPSLWFALLIVVFTCQFFSPIYHLRDVFFYLYLHPSLYPFPPHLRDVEHTQILFFFVCVSLEPIRFFFGLFFIFFFFLPPFLVFFYFFFYPPCCFRRIRCGVLYPRPECSPLTILLPTPPLPILGVFF